MLLTRRTAVLAALSFFCIVLVFFRISYTGHITYAFMVWNLFLAWIPMLLAVTIRNVSGGGKRRSLRARLAAGIGLAGLWLGWLLFLPNAPYMMTDFIHMLYLRGDISVWHDMLLFFAFAWTGLELWCCALDLARDTVRRAAGAVRSWLFCGAVVLLTSLGIYLGRFGRWNSWDIVSSPLRLVQDAMQTITGGEEPLRFMAGFAVFLTLVYLARANGPELYRNRREQPREN